jgi:hypothetical protein
MGTFRGMVAGFLLVCVVGQSASAGPIYMPVGSTVWMKAIAAIAPDADIDAFAGSNLPGVAPPNGIPLTTITGSGTYATGFAEVLPTRIRMYGSSGLSIHMFASFQDTYTVGGTAAGPFDITIQFRATGTMSTVQTGSFHQLLAGNVQAEIGTFSPISDAGGVPLNESFRVTPFADQPSAEARSEVVDRFVQATVPFDITATYIKTVSVGDVFDIGYGLRAATSKGTMDLMDTGTISFVLPEGVTLSSSLSQSIPEPNAMALLLAAACGLALRARRRGPGPVGVGRDASFG